MKPLILPGLILQFLCSFLLAPGCSNPSPDGGGNIGGSCPEPELSGCDVDTAPSCGNGSRDRDLLCFESLVDEQCEGDDLAGQTCEGLGFVGGHLRCRADCHFDVTSCTLCSPDARVPYCLFSPDSVEGALPRDGYGALGATRWGDTVAAGWTGSGGLRLALIDPADGSFLLNTGCIVEEGAGAVALAATPTGGIVAVEVNDDLDVIVLDRDMRPRGEPRHILGASQPILASRPDGGPLLVFQQGSAVMAALLDEEGTEAFRTSLIEGGLEVYLGSAVWVGDGFLVAQRDLAAGVRLHRVNVDGTVAEGTWAHGGSAEYPKILWSGTEALMTYADFGSGPVMAWARFDKYGVSLSEPVPLVDSSSYFNVAPIVRVGNESIALLAGSTGLVGLGTSLVVARLGDDGIEQGDRIGITEATNIYDHRIVALDDSAVVLWIQGQYPGRLARARVELNP